MMFSAAVILAYDKGIMIAHLLFYRISTLKGATGSI